MTRLTASRFISLATLFGTALLLARCGGSSGTPPNTIATSGSNVQPITVGDGPAGNYANGIFTSITVCVPSTSNCQTISNVLVDTGSYGLRLLSSSGGGALTLSLPQQSDSSGNPIGECGEFVDGFTWGPVVTADVEISGEKASSLPVEIIDPAFASVPTACQQTGLTNRDTLQALGTNGILGVGPFMQDCGGACALPNNSSQNPGLYFSCVSNSCQVVSEAVAQQVANPVGSFATDNNGVIVELPAVSAPTASISGSLVFGIGTESNNGLSGAQVFPLNSNAEFTTTFGGQSYPGFIDSGSNGLYFLDSDTTSLPVCSDDSSFYCPSSTASLSATTASGGVTADVNFTVENADALFSNPTAFVLPGLAGPNPGIFDWGLPFFFGRNVFTAIESRSTPAGAGPYWAF
jgi:hypothetical protein